jgi:hypothetical protein
VRASEASPNVPPRLMSAAARPHPPHLRVPIVLDDEAGQANRVHFYRNIMIPSHSVNTSAVDSAYAHCETGRFRESKKGVTTSGADSGTRIG